MSVLKKNCRFEKKCRFRDSETIDSFHTIGVKFPGNLKCIFDDVRYFTGGLLLKTRVMPSSSHIAMRFFKERPAASKRFFDLDMFGVHPTRLQHPMFRINLNSHGCGLGRRTTWYGRFSKHSSLIVWKLNHNMKFSVDRLQGLAPVFHLYQHLCASYNYDMMPARGNPDVT